MGSVEKTGCVWVEVTWTEGGKSSSGGEVPGVCDVPPEPALERERDLNNVIRVVNITGDNTAVIMEDLN